MSEIEKLNESKKNIPDAVTEKLGWGEKSKDNYGYDNDEDRREKRGLEDWEMVTSMEKTDVSIPKWFLALFLVLLLVAIGLTFPFWGNRPGYERPWFDWGIPLGAAWVIGSSLLIYYFVDYRHILEDKKKEKEKEKEKEKNNES